MTAAGGGYRFDPDKVQTAINELRAIQHGLEHEDIPKAQYLLQTKPPGTDPATLAFQSKMQESHQHHLGELRSLSQKVKVQIENLEAAMRQYHETETSNRQAFRQRGA
ncbi:hypothetical protein [Gandjariella thermophila]|uniref:PE domain-containing protein n=1 Tax=Gandjariella thermophila TaxID=1931992 RepID=A0A4D4JBX6_9PSEU|nr:hypothetical protein [Gandjariella thermophila]GDY33094.1 hypothetical protein GTS_47270 [Gandjariella thermophila]